MAEYPILNSVDSYTSRSVPIDVAGTIQRRQQLELQARQQEQAMREQALNRAERVREFNSNAANLYGENTVIGPDGMVNPIESARRVELKKAKDAEMMMRGINDAENPTRKPADYLTPEMLGAASATGQAIPEVPQGLSQEQLSSPSFMTGKMSREKEIRDQASKIALEKERFGGRRGLSATKMEATDVQRMDRFLRGNDPNYEPVPYLDIQGSVIPEAASSISDQYSQIAPKNTATRNLPMAARIASMTDQELIEQGFDPERIPAMREAAANRANQKSIQAKEFVSNVEKSLPGGRKLSDKERADLTQKYIGGGSAALNAPPSVVKDIESENIASQRLDEVTKSIEDFNKKYGDNAIDEYIGPIDNPVFKFKSKAVPTAERKAADREARDIFRKAKLIVQGYRKENFGTALTATETSQFRDIVGDESFADYTDALKSFGDSMKGAVSKRLVDYELAPNIPRTIKDRFSTQPTAKKVGRFTIESE